MAYAPIDDELNDNEKILGLSHEEFRLWVAGLAWLYGKRKPGDYLIPRSVVTGLAASHGVKVKAISGLVKKLAWHETERGYEVHDADHHDYREKRSRAGKLAAEVRWSHTNALPTHSDRNANAKRTQSERNASRGVSQTLTQSSKALSPNVDKAAQPTVEIVDRLNPGKEFVDAARAANYEPLPDDVKRVGLAAKKAREAGRSDEVIRAVCQRLGRERKGPALFNRLLADVESGASGNAHVAAKDAEMAGIAARWRS